MGARSRLRVRHRQVSGPDAGASALEYGAILAVGALVLGVIGFFVAPGGMVGQNVEYAICKLFNGENNCVSPKEKELKPAACTTVSTTETRGSTIDIAFIQFGKEITFIRSTDSAGKVTITAVNTDSLGAGAGIGGGINWGNKINLGAEANVAANFKFGAGDSWIFDSQADADRFMGEIRKKAALDGLKRIGGIPGVGGLITRKIDPPKVRDADITRSETEFNVSAGASAAFGLGDAKKDGNGNPMKPGQKDETGVPANDNRGDSNVKPNLRAYVSIEGKNKALVESDRRDGSRSVTMEIGGGYKTGFGYVIDGKEWRGQVSGAMKMTFDRDGRLTKLTLTRTTIVDNRLTSVSTELPITNDAERAAVRQHLDLPAEYFKGTPAEPVIKMNGTPLQLTWDDMAPINPPGPGASPLQKLLYDKGITQKVDYDYSSTDLPYSVGVKLGLKLGFGTSVGNKNQKATQADYLGAPGPDGRRTWKTFKECKS